MGQGIDNQFVREHYQAMSDNELKRLAIEDLAGLTDEAQAIVKDEIVRRGFDLNLVKGVVAQNKQYTIDEINEYCRILQQLKCPHCGESSGKLNATLTSEVMSFVFITQHRKKLIVACADCLNKANNKALIKSILLGWWGIPWGIIRTIQAINTNLKSKNAIDQEMPNDYFREFALSRIGNIEVSKNNKEQLQNILLQ